MTAVPLKARLGAGELIVGTFVKTPAPILIEVLGLTALDCLCLDAEHAPFDRVAIDGCVMAARASAIDILVRTPSAAPEHILNALDCGATGIVIPHVRSADEARAAVRACHYGPGGRGYAGSSRAAGYTTRTMADHQAASAARTVVVAQIEDPEAIDDIDAIAQVEGIDALFVGRVDLTVAYGADSQDDPRVVAAVEAVCAAGRRMAGRSACSSRASATCRCGARRAQACSCSAPITPSCSMARRGCQPAQGTSDLDLKFVPLFCLSP